MKKPRITKVYEVFFVSMDAALTQDLKFEAFFRFLVTQNQLGKFSHQFFLNRNSLGLSFVSNGDSPLNIIHGSFLWTLPRYSQFLVRTSKTFGHFSWIVVLGMRRRWSICIWETILFVQWKVGIRWLYFMSIFEQLRGTGFVLWCWETGGSLEVRFFVGALTEKIRV